MLNESELILIHHYANGTNDRGIISEKMGRTRTQINNIVKGLKIKGILSDSDEMKITTDPFAIRLMNIMRPSKGIAKLFSNSGLDILIELREPKTIKELESSLGISQATAYRRLRTAMDVGAVIEQCGSYQINKIAWPELSDLLNCAFERKRVFDERIPRDSEILIRKGKETVFSNPRQLDFNNTGFTIMGELDLELGFCDRYYTTSVERIGIKDAFEDAFNISNVKDDYRLRLMLILFYEKNKDMINPPEEFLKIRDMIMSGTKVPRWPTLKDIESRLEAEI